MILDPEVYKKASKDTATSMTMELRKNALNAGWEKDVVDNMKVKYGKSGFKVRIHPDYQYRAHVHEYGTETKKPTAVIRKYNNPDSGLKDFGNAVALHAGDN
jgi:hypothetical protein